MKKTLLFLSTSIIILGASFGQAIILPDTFTTLENPGNGTLIGTASTSGGGGVGFSSSNFSIISGNTHEAFSIGTIDGKIKANNSDSIIVKYSPFILNVRLIYNDFGNMDTSYADIQIDVFDGSYIEDQAFTVYENPKNGSSVGTIVYTSDSVVTLKFTDGDTAIFAVDSLSGEITVKDSTNITLGNTPFTVDVEMNDGDTVLTAIITINVVAVGDTVAPIILPQDFSIARDPAAFAEIGTVVATDDNPLTYKIVGGTPGVPCFIGTNDGKLGVQNETIFDCDPLSDSIVTVDVEVDDGSNTAEATMTIKVTGCTTTTNINEKSLLDFSVTPNWNNNALTIVLPSKENVRVTLLDNTGRLVNTFSNRTSPISLDMSTHTSGVYFIKINLDNGQSGTKKVVISINLYRHLFFKESHQLMALFFMFVLSPSFYPLMEPFVKCRNIRYQNSTLT